MVEIIHHEVVKGETASGIAASYDTLGGWPALVRANPSIFKDGDPRLMAVGQVLHIPSATNPPVEPPKDPIPDPTPSGVVIRPGENIQAAAIANPEGTRFLLGAGTHSLSAPIVPKSGQQFVGDGEAILTGNDVTAICFKGETANGVEVSGLIIERFVSVYNGHAALHAASGWIIVDNEIRYNAGAGIYHETDCLVARNKIHHNGWYGVGGFKAHRSVVEDNEVYENGASGLPDRAGSKWVAGIDLVVRNNHYHHNYNNAIWLDADHVNALVEGNLVEDNYDKGLHWEISCSGIWRNNISQRNGVGMFLISSGNTEVYDNQFLDNDEAFRAWHGDRGRPSGASCQWAMSNANVHHNTFRGGRVWLALNGLPQEVTFDYNNYEGVSFVIDGSVNWADWQASGNDANGSFTA